MLKQEAVFNLNNKEKVVLFSAFLPNRTAFIIVCNNVTVTKVIHKYFGSSETTNLKPIVFEMQFAGRVGLDRNLFRGGNKFENKEETYFPMWRNRSCSQALFKIKLLN